MITGGTNGIGKETAVGLAQKGYQIIIIGRDPERTEAAVKEIKIRSDNQRVSYFNADFSQLSDVRKLADDFLRRYETLNVLINTAGFISRKRILTKEGFESQWAVNYLSPFLLTHLLLDRLKKNAPSRIVNVSAKAHEWGQIDFNDLQREHKYSGLKMYSQCKLASNMFTFELSRHLEDGHVTVNCLHPGIIRTGFDVGAMSRFFTLFRPFFQSTEKGARTSIYLATSPEVDRVTGKYFANKKVKKSAKRSMERDAQKKLWELSMKQVGLE